ncbi:cell division protein FtsQ/DivIB [Thalassococcus lentus]|uniref:Cell division protein FtsQ n=1 Tax=Thalassococcus lentus TaxID=1210524 RepID=A0ABT4XTJ9_9RHOB|nr:cell division protein FtsQ/DivIB [Thalassococcus lentus]MDA7425251.1 cell division protein FtsQ/DivIB [Thalassococcus lentus]
MRQIEANDPQMARLDPSGSRLKYRIERLMLTPLFRGALRVGVPLALTFGLGTWWFSVDDNRNAFNTMIADLRTQVESRPEFQVKLMAIDGASDAVAADIRTILPVEFPISSFDLNLDEMQQSVVGLDAVRKAHLRIKQGGVLQVDVTERIPKVLWRREDALELLDGKGNRVADAHARAHHADLPVIAGDGAERAVPEALALHAVAGPLSGRVRGFERMGARRWDVVLDRGQRIMLPEDGAVRALERTIAMQQAVQMLDRDLIAVDLRLPQRPTVRMTEQATQAMWQFKAIEAGGEQQQ